MENEPYGVRRLARGQHAREAWVGVADVRRELGALEVATAWRRRGVGGRLLGRIGAEAGYADRILIAQALACHWDLWAAGTSAGGYRRFLQRMLERAGFRAFATDDPEVADDRASFLAARIGDDVQAYARADFERLLHAA